MRNTDDMIREIQKYEKDEKYNKDRNMRNTTKIEIWERWEIQMIQKYLAKEIYSPQHSYQHHIDQKYGGW